MTQLHGLLAARVPRSFATSTCARLALEQGAALAGEHGGALVGEHGACLVRGQYILHFYYILSHVV